MMSPPTSSTLQSLLKIKTSSPIRGLMFLASLGHLSPTSKTKISREDQPSPSSLSKILYSPPNELGREKFRRSCFLSGLKESIQKNKSSPCTLTKLHMGDPIGASMQQPDLTSGKKQRI